jgi:hypothetical protein
MKAYGEVDVYIHVFLTSALVAGKSPASQADSHCGEEKTLYSAENRTLAAQHVARTK